jgi:hypothetical protein
VPFVCFLVTAAYGLAFWMLGERFAPSPAGR